LPDSISTDELSRVVGYTVLAVTQARGSFDGADYDKAITLAVVKKSARPKNRGNGSGALLSAVRRQILSSKVLTDLSFIKKDPDGESCQNTAALLEWEFHAGFKKASNMLNARSILKKVQIPRR
jgi:hypothetical protein